MNRLTPSGGNPFDISIALRKYLRAHPVPSQLIEMAQCTDAQERLKFCLTQNLANIYRLGDFEPNLRARLDEVANRVMEEQGVGLQQARDAVICLCILDNIAESLRAA